MRITVRRWAFLLLGGALSAPYAMLFVLWISLFHGPAFGIPGPLFIGAFAVLLAAGVAVLPTTRRMEIALARPLLGTVGGHRGRATGPQWRGGLWHALHLVLGSIATALTGIAPFALVTCLIAPFVDGVFGFYGWHSHPGRSGLLVALGGVLGTAVAAALVIGSGAALARAAPVLLGPSRAERFAELEHQAQALAERNRLARELHDSIGHALTVTTLQAGTAHRLFDRDPAFARQALAAIAETGRTAMADLDHVVGLLRDGTSTQVAPDLAELDQLLEVNRGLGLEVDATVTGPVGAIPGTISRELFRIVQESLTNAVTHAEGRPVVLRIAATAEGVELEVTNPLRAERPSRAGGRGPGRRDGHGYGLNGMRERVHLLRGEMSAGPERERWRVHVRLPST